MARFVSVFARFVLAGSVIGTVPASVAQTEFAEPVALAVQTPPPPPALSGPAVRTPAMGRIEVFDNWAVGCDNRLNCTAVSLLTEGVSEPYSILLVISRAGGVGGAVSVQLMAADPMKGKVDLMVDGTRLTRLDAKPEGIELIGDEGLAFARKLGGSFAFDVAQRGRTLDQPSLTGLPPALRFIDQQQGRVGAQDALVAAGIGNPANARTVPQMPSSGSEIADTDRLTEDVITPLSDTEEATVRKLATCDGGLVSRYPLELHMLDKTHQLVLLPCDAGAYNVSFVPLVAKSETGGEAGARSFAVAQFDAMPGYSGEPGSPPLVVNARWNPRLGLLASFAKGRGLGDCGTAEDYRWDGAQFRLEEARAMPVCRGAWEWPRIYSAR